MLQLSILHALCYPIAIVHDTDAIVETTGFTARYIFRVYSLGTEVRNYSVK